MLIQIGQIVQKRFRVDALVGTGGMCVVYRVSDLTSNSKLAMKVLHSDLAEDRSALKKFKREANALKNMPHPNIVTFYGVYQTNSTIFLLERYVDGPTLQQILRENNEKPLPVLESLIYMKAISSALGFAHKNGVVHCDVKPANILVESSGEIYLTDFGIARHAESTLTTIGIAGTAAYMSPEQCRGEIVLTALTDVYALGILFYEMLVGNDHFWEMSL